MVHGVVPELSRRAHQRPVVALLLCAIVTQEHEKPSGLRPAPGFRLVLFRDLRDRAGEPLGFVAGEQMGLGSRSGGSSKSCSRFGGRLVGFQGGGVISAFFSSARFLLPLQSFLLLLFAFLFKFFLFQLFLLLFLQKFPLFNLLFLSLLRFALDFQVNHHGLNLIKNFLLLRLLRRRLCLGGCFFALLLSLDLRSLCGGFLFTSFLFLLVLLLLPNLRR